MDISLQILLTVIPVLFVSATTYYLIKGFFESEEKRRRAEMKMGVRELITPVRLQAYERVVLFLERITPNSLVMRTFKNGMSGKMMQSELIKAIRSEYEHNMSQQVYMSNQAWEVVKTAKEETVKLINIASTKVPDTASGMDLANAVIEISSQIPKLPTQVAIEAVKRELSDQF
jgi:hypothetical protein